MQQIIKETKIKYINYTAFPPYPTYEKNNTKDLLLESNIILTNPKEYHNSILIISKETDAFIPFAKDVNYIEIISDDLFLIKISTILIIKTKQFCYMNDLDPINIDIANGTYNLDLNGNLIPSTSLRDIKIEYIFAKGI
jgi:hypothetical protein